MCGFNGKMSREGFRRKCLSANYFEMRPKIRWVDGWKVEKHVTKKIK